MSAVATLPDRIATHTRYVAPEVAKPPQHFPSLTRADLVAQGIVRPGSGVFAWDDPSPEQIRPAPCLRMSPEDRERAKFHQAQGKVHRSREPDHYD